MTGDKTNMAHLVDSDPDLVRAAYDAGTIIEAVCGYRWVPFRPAEGLPLCAECVTIAHLNLEAAQ